MKKHIYFSSTRSTVMVVFPQTGHTWGLARGKWTYRELIVLFLFALEQFNPRLRKVIGNRFVV